MSGCIVHSHSPPIFQQRFAGFPRLSRSPMTFFDILFNIMSKLSQSTINADGMPRGIGHGVCVGAWRMVCASIGHGAWRMVQHIGRQSAWCRSWRYRVGHGSVTAWAWGMALQLAHGAWYRAWRMGYGVGYIPLVYLT